MKPIAIILAAGESRRMGLVKALLEAGPGISFLQQLVGTFAAAGIPSLVVTGAHASEIFAAHPEVPSVLNAGWARGQLSSVQVGLRAALVQGSERILIHPVDAPLIAAATAAEVLAALDQSEAVIPTSAALPGHPIGLTARAARAVLNSPATTLAEAAGLLRAQLLAVEDPAILDNLNSAEAYALRFGHAARAGWPHSR